MSSMSNLGSGTIALWAMALLILIVILLATAVY